MKTSTQSRKSSKSSLASINHLKANRLKARRQIKIYSEVSTKGSHWTAKEHKVCMKAVQKHGTNLYEGYSKHGPSLKANKASLRKSSWTDEGRQTSSLSSHSSSVWKVANFSKRVGTQQTRSVSQSCQKHGKNYQIQKPFPKVETWTYSNDLSKRWLSYPCCL